MEMRSRPRPPPQSSKPFTVTLPPVTQNGQVGKLCGHYEHPVPREPPKPSKTDPITPENITFSFGRRIIRATGTASDDSHPNVLILQRQQTWFERILHMLLSYFPAVIACWLRKNLREWCLPESIVLKAAKDGWDEEFEREKATYEYLQPLQGVTIPRYYGCLDYEGKKALVLSNIGGACLATPEGAVLDERDLRELVMEALTALTSMGVAYDDTKLDNFHLVTDNGRDKIMIVDLEIVDQSLSEDDLAFTTECEMNHLIRLYRMHLDCLQHDGHLLPKRGLKRREMRRRLTTWDGSYPTSNDIKLGETKYTDALLSRKIGQEKQSQLPGRIIRSDDDADSALSGPLVLIGAEPRRIL